MESYRDNWDKSFPPPFACPVVSHFYRLLHGARGIRVMIIQTNGGRSKKRGLATLEVKSKGFSSIFAPRVSKGECPYCRGSSSFGFLVSRSLLRQILPPDICISRHARWPDCPSPAQVSRILVAVECAQSTSAGCLAHLLAAPSPARIASINALSISNKSFVLNDTFCREHMDCMVLTES